MERGDGLAALKEISTNGDLLLFAGHNSTIAALKHGSGLLIKGHLLEVAHPRIDARRNELRVS